MGQGVKFGWPIYNVFYEVEKIDGFISTGFFYVKLLIALMAMAENPDLKVKYVYHEEFFNDYNSDHIYIEESSFYEFVTDKKPLCYHVYNMKRNKHF